MWSPTCSYGSQTVFLDGGVSRFFFMFCSHRRVYFMLGRLINWNISAPWVCIFKNRWSEMSLSYTEKVNRYFLRCSTHRPITSSTIMTIPPSNRNRCQSQEKCKLLGNSYRQRKTKRKPGANKQSLVSGYCTLWHTGAVVTASSFQLFFLKCACDIQNKRLFCWGGVEMCCTAHLTMVLMAVLTKARACQLK